MAQPDEPYWRPPVRGWPRAGSVFSGAIAASAIAVGVAALAQGVPEADGAPAPEATTGISQDAQGADLQRRLVSDVGSLLATHCLDCHGPTKSKGGVRFDAIAGKDATLAVALDMADDLSMARELVRTGEMPPKDRPRPTEHERLILDQWLEAALKYVPPDATPDPGWFTIHRLNRTEYRNTLRDLLGIDPAEFDVAARLPRDDTGYGFDNIADVLTVSPLSVEQYVDAAEAAIERALGPVVEVGDTPPRDHTARCDDRRRAGVRWWRVPDVERCGTRRVCGARHRRLHDPCARLGGPRRSGQCADERACRWQGSTGVRDHRDAG